MPDGKLRAAVQATISTGLPDLETVALRARRRRFTAQAAVVLGVVVAASVVWLAALPVPTPGFEDQVEAFVALVWAD